MINTYYLFISDKVYHTKINQACKMCSSAVKAVAREDSRTK